VSLVQRVVKRFERLDILVNNAVASPRASDALPSLPKPLADVSPDEWDMAYAVTVRGTFMLCRESIPYLKQQPRAFIVNIGTQATRRCQEGAGVYVATKQAVRGMSIVLSKELRKTTGIRVHLVHPGGTNTNLLTDMLKVETTDLVVQTSLTRDRDTVFFFDSDATHDRRANVRPKIYIFVSVTSRAKEWPMV